MSIKVQLYSSAV